MAMAMAMALSYKNVLLITFLLIFVAFSSGISDTTVDFDGASPSFSLDKDNGAPVWMMKARKLLMDSLLDYEDACANSKHLPVKKPCKNP